MGMSILESALHQTPPNAHLGLSPWVFFSSPGRRQTRDSFDEGPGMVTVGTGASPPPPPGDRR